MINKEINFSVVIPLYNKQNHIHEAINSVLEQTHKSFEVIVVDDGSTDNSNEIASAIRDPRLRIIRQDNRGVSAARNRGVKESNNDWVAFLDADDTWEKGFLHEIFNLMQQIPNCGMYTSTFTSNFSMNLSIDQKNPYPLGFCTILDNIFDTLRIYHPFNSSCVAINRALLKKVGGFPDNINAGEDTITWIKIGLVSKIGFINLPLSTYNNDADNRASDYLIPPDISAPAEFVDSLIKTNSIPIEILESAKEYLAKLLISSAKQKIRNHHPIEAIKILWKCKNTKKQIGIWIKILLFATITLIFPKYSTRM